MGGSCPQTPNSGRVAVKHLEMQDEEGARLVVANFLVLESFVLVAVRIGQVTMFPETFHQTNIVLCSATFHLYTKGKVLYL